MDTFCLLCAHNNLNKKVIIKSKCKRESESYYTHLTVILIRAKNHLQTDPLL